MPLAFQGSQVRVLLPRPSKTPALQWAFYLVLVVWTTKLRPIGVNSLWLFTESLLVPLGTLGRSSILCAAHKMLSSEQREAQVRVLLLVL